MKTTCLLSQLFIAFWYLNFIFLTGIIRIAVSSGENSNERGGNNDTCVTANCIRAAATILANMDPDEDPCEDFYKFACGNFQAQFGAFDKDKEIHVDTHLDNWMKPYLKNLLTMHNDVSVIPTFRKLKDFFASCLNTSILPEKGFQRVQELLDKYGGWPILVGPSWNDSNFQWDNVTSNLMSEGLDITSVLGVDLFFNYDMTLSGNYRLIQIRKPSVLSKKVAAREAYETLVKDASIYLGAPQETVASDVQELMAFLDEYTKIIEEQTNAVNDTDNLFDQMEDNFSDEFFTLNDTSNMSEMLSGRLISLANLTNLTEEFDWQRYLSCVFPISLTDDTLIYLHFEPTKLTNIIQFMHRAPKRSLANFILWKVVYDLIDFIQDATLLKFKETYRQAVFNRRFYRKDRRWIRCLTETSAFLLPALTAFYSKQNFPLEDRAEVLEMFEALRSAAQKSIRNVDWLNNDTIHHLEQNLLRTGSIIGYPSDLLNDEILENFYKNLTIHKDEYLLNILNMRKLHLSIEAKETQKNVSSNDWTHIDSILYTNAYYYRFISSVVLPVSQLRGIYFARDRLAALNYGSLASILGHELYHGLNDFGLVKYEHKMNWWKPEDTQAFINRTKCIERQYDNFRITGKIMVNGTQTLDENIADNSGLKVAYSAYQEWIETHGPEPKLIGFPNYNGRQIFWIAFANAWCSSTNIIVQSKDEPYRAHSPNNFRVIGALQNLPEFAEDFQCQANSPMNPKEKCSVW